MSLQSRVLLGMVAIVAVVVAAAVLITGATRSYLIDQVDRRLDSAAPAVAFFSGPLPGDFTPGTGGAPGGQVQGQATPSSELSSIYFGQISADGIVSTVATPGLAGPNASEPVVDVGQAQRAASGGAFTVDAADGRGHYRLVAQDAPDGTVFLVGLPLDDVEAAVDRLIAVEVAAVVLVAGAAGLVAFWVLRLGVRPIKAMTGTAIAIADGDLSRRVEESSPRTEAGRLATALNVMLGRIEQSFAARTASENRMRRFVADASHELRTPLTTIRGYAELYCGGGLATDGALDDAMRRTEQEAARMGALVDDLVVLARLDETRALEQEPVDLATIATDVVADARRLDPGRPITLTTPVAGAPAAVVVGDDGALRQVLGNLMGNALGHTEPSTPVTVEVTRQDQEVCVAVSDEGPGMDVTDASHAFERFYRADASRTRANGGSGLGLSIVQALVEGHGGRVDLDTSPGAGVTVVVRLPAA